MVDVLFTPADFALLPQRDLRDRTCIVFDVLRATTSIVTGLAQGATAFIPVAEISEALALRHEHPDYVLAGERDGLRIRRDLAGTCDFDLGNSPREFTSATVGGRVVVTTTTNGTRALRACAAASAVLVACFRNLEATSHWLEGAIGNGDLLLICSGTFEETAYEDVLAAGAFCELIAAYRGRDSFSDAAHLAEQIWRLGKDDLLGAMRFSRNARRLASRPELAPDVAFCLERNACSIVAQFANGAVRQVPA